MCTLAFTWPNVRVGGFQDQKELLFQEVCIVWPQWNLPILQNCIMFFEMVYQTLHTWGGIEYGLMQEYCKRDPPGTGTGYWAVSFGAGGWGVQVPAIWTVHADGETCPEPEEAAAQTNEEAVPVMWHWSSIRRRERARREGGGASSCDAQSTGEKN